MVVAGFVPTPLGEIVEYFPTLATTDLENMHLTPALKPD